MRMGQDTIASTDKKLKHLNDDLSKRLTEDVYTDDEKEVIDQTRVLLDLPSLAKSVHTIL